MELFFDIAAATPNVSLATGYFSECYQNRCIEKNIWLSTSLHLSVYQSRNITPPHILNDFRKFFFFSFSFLFCLSKVLFLTYINWDKEFKSGLSKFLWKTWIQPELKWAGWFLSSQLNFSLKMFLVDAYLNCYPTIPFEFWRPSSKLSDKIFNMTL